MFAKAQHKTLSMHSSVSPQGLSLVFVPGLAIGHGLLGRDNVEPSLAILLVELDGIIVQLGEHVLRWPWES
jgi:hypothetical protein